MGSYRRTIELLNFQGFREDAGDMDPRKMRTNPRSVTGFPQIYILDPDRNLIEINAEKLD